MGLKLRRRVELTLHFSCFLNEPKNVKTKQENLTQYTWPQKKFQSTYVPKGMPHRFKNLFEGELFTPYFLFLFHAFNFFASIFSRALLALLALLASLVLSAACSHKLANLFCFSQTSEGLLSSTWRNDFAAPLVSFRVKGLLASDTATHFSASLFGAHASLFRTALNEYIALRYNHLAVVAVYFFLIKGCCSLQGHKYDQEA